MSTFNTRVLCRVTKMDFSMREVHLEIPGWQENAILPMEDFDGHSELKRLMTVDYRFHARVATENSEIKQFLSFECDGKTLEEQEAMIEKAQARLDGKTVH